MATPRVRLTTSPGWEVVRAEPRRAAARAAAGDPFLARALATRRLALAGSARVRPRRGAPAGPGRAAATVEAPESDGLRRRRPPRLGRADVPPDGLVRGRRARLRRAAPVPGAPGSGRDGRALHPARRGRRGPGGAAVPRAGVGEAPLRRRARAARPRARSRAGETPSSPRARRGRCRRGPEKCLLFLHGTFSHASAAFGDLAQDPSAFDALAAAYGGRVYAFNHLTVGRAPGDNVKDLRPLVAGARVDVVTHSRGGLVLRALAAGKGAPAIGRAFLAASPLGGDAARVSGAVGRDGRLDREPRRGSALRRARLRPRLRGRGARLDRAARRAARCPASPRWTRRASSSTDLNARPAGDGDVRRRRRGLHAQGRPRQAPPRRGRRRDLPDAERPRRPDGGRALARAAAASTRATPCASTETSIT